MDSMQDFRSSCISAYSLEFFKHKYNKILKDIIFANSEYLSALIFWSKCILFKEYLDIPTNKTRPKILIKKSFYHASVLIRHDML